jgi:hypothetical protein
LKTATGQHPFFESLICLKNIHLIDLFAPMIDCSTSGSLAARKSVARLRRVAVVRRQFSGGPDGNKSAGKIADGILLSTGC